MAKKPVDPKQTRTVAVLGHRSSGKTSVIEAALLAGGVVRALDPSGSRAVLLDHDPHSRRRQATMQTGFVWLPWRDHLVQLVDTSGSQELDLQREAVLDGVDAAVVVVDASQGVQLGTRRALESCVRRELPVLVVVNKCDRDCAVQPLLDELGTSLPTTAVPLNLPMEGTAPTEPGLVGVIDLVEQRGWRYLDDASGQFSVEPLPASEAWLEQRERLVESVAMSDESLLDEYLEYLELGVDKVRDGLARATRQGGLTPVLFASANQAVGAHHLLDAVVDLLPSPVEATPPLQRDSDLVCPSTGPFAAQVMATGLDDTGAPFAVCRVRTGAVKRAGSWTLPDDRGRFRVNKLYHLRGPRRGLANYTGPGAVVATWDLPGVQPGDVLSDRGDVIASQPLNPRRSHAIALRCPSSADERRLPTALKTLLTADPLLRTEDDPLTGATVLSGGSRLQLDLAVERLAQLGVQVEAGEVPIAYRESPCGRVRGIEGLHRRTDDDDFQTEFGRVVVDMLPTEPTTPLRVVFSCTQDDLPTRFHRAVEEGARRALAAGPLAGYPVTGVQLVVVEGQYDAIFSTDEHLALAAERAVRHALGRTGTELVEPWRRGIVRVGSAHVGGAVSATGAHRGRVVGMEQTDREAVIEVELPESEWSGLQAQLSSLSGGTADLCGEYAHHETLPKALSSRVVRSSPVLHRRIPTVPPPAPVEAERVEAGGR